jgi:hypothetical protein
MSGPAPKTTAPPAAPAGNHRAWLLALAALLAWQGWQALGLFGRDRPLERLWSDEPVISGRHALHLYHGTLGSRALLERGSLSCYDPAFHAGYPKTPVFDSGSRPAELALALAGGRYSPAAYKVALALLCLAAPVLLYTAGRAVGLGRGPACLATALGLLVWWGQPCRDALEAGAVDLLLAALFVLAEVGLLIHYHRAPGALSLLGVTGAVLLGCFAHPLLLTLVLPLFLVYYLSVGTRHRLAWHVALLGGMLAAVGANAFWLVDWVNYWWIQVPALADGAPSQGWRDVWEAPAWGGPVDRALACVLIGTAAAGVVLYNACSQRPTARLLGLGWAGFLALAVLGLAWDPLGRLGGAHLLVPALLFAAIPAAHAAGELLAWLWRLGALRWAGVGLACVAGAGGWAARDSLSQWAPRLGESRQLQVGLGEARLALVEALREATTAEARVLWEDHHGSAQEAQWTALLPLLTDRAYLGGLDAEAAIEHAAGGLVDGSLAGRPLAEWTDAELHDYCQRYNVGWVACWSPRSRERFARWAEAGAGVELPPCPCADGRRLFTLGRPHTFALRGSARLLGADAQRIVLADVQPQRAGPDDHRGQVVLSLHYQAGMRVAPSRVRLERAEESQDSIPFVRLVVDDPVTRLTITWDKH